MGLGSGILKKTFPDPGSRVKQASVLDPQHCYCVSKQGNKWVTFSVCGLVLLGVLQGVLLLSLQVGIVLATPRLPLICTNTDFEFFLLIINRRYKDNKSAQHPN